MALERMFNNIKAVVFSAPNFIQLLYVTKILWWGIGGIFGVRFVITYLNFLVIYPINLILIIVGLTGLIGLILNKYSLNILFALSMVFISGCIGLTFLRHASQSISAGTYFIDIFGVMWLSFRLQQDYWKEKRFLKFRGK